MEPVADPATVIVYGGGVESVRHVIVDGRVVVSGGELATADGIVIRREARAAAAAVSRRLRWE
jgi:cytosine/adenosine deaminase-related metal-dependent hydrolase